MIVFEWTSDASGDVSGPEAEINIPGGSLYAMLAVPKSGVTDAYDVTVSMRKNFQTCTAIAIADLLSGDGANLSNSTDGQLVLMGQPIPLLPDARLSLVVANAGNAQSGTIVLVIWDELF
jgi:hypothetical protein